MGGAGPYSRTRWYPERQTPGTLDGHGETLELPCDGLPRRVALVLPARMEAVQLAPRRTGQALAS